VERKTRAGEARPDDISLRLLLPAELPALGEIRVQLGRFPHRNAIGGDVHSDALLIAHELAANAVQHGSAPGDEIELHAEILPRRLYLTVSDRARRRSAPVALTPDDTRKDGRGLQIVAELAN
jgi:anti-sigma regulatory factor (Ser/Thr protein kinase)